jgi:hypothetical protein
MTEDFFSQTFHCTAFIFNSHNVVNTTSDLDYTILVEQNSLIFIEMNENELRDT